MYSVKIDENNFYLGIYAKIGKIKNGIDITDLPPSENQFCYFINSEHEWEFSQDKYDELEEKRISDEKLKAEQTEFEKTISAENQYDEIETLKTENQSLKNEISMLTECILEMSELLYV